MKKAYPILFCWTGLAISSACGSSGSIGGEPPTSLPSKIAFTDSDTDKGEVSGTVTIDAASNESDVKSYAVYWGLDETTKVNNPVLLADLAVTGSAVSFEIPANTEPPRGAAYLTAFAKNEIGESTSATTVKLVDDYAAGTSSPSSLELNDLDKIYRYITGSLIVGKASDEAAVSKYIVYWGSAATTKLDTHTGTPVAEFAKTGSNLSIYLENIIIPSGATHLIAYTINSSGEESAGKSLAISDRKPTAKAPVIWPISGTYSGPQTVQISTTEGGLTIYFTVDGSTPTKLSNRYTNQFAATALSSSVKAIAIGEGYDDSPVASVSYTIYTLSGLGYSIDAVPRSVSDGQFSTTHLTYGTTFTVRSTCSYNNQTGYRFSDGYLVYYITDTTKYVVFSPSYWTGVLGCPAAQL